MPSGRPPKLVIEPGLLERLLGYVRKGAHPHRAAMACGISERTHYYWQDKGLEEREHREAGKKPRVTWQAYLDYVDGLDQAIAEAEMTLLEQASAGGAAGAGAMTILERRFRDRWSSRSPAVPAKAAPTSGSVTQSAGVTPLDQFARRRESRNGRTGRN